jgi:hypothetical protein
MPDQGGDEQANQDRATIERRVRAIREVNMVFSVARVIVFNPEYR